MYPVLNPFLKDKIWKQSKYIVTIICCTYITCISIICVTLVTIFK